MFLKLSVQQKKAFFLLIAIIFYALSFFTYSKKLVDQSYFYSSFFDLFGLLALDKAVTYKNDEEKLIIYTLIEKKIDGDMVSAYSKIATTSSIITIIGVCLSFINYRKLGYVSLQNKGFIIVLHFLFFLTYSLWIRKDQLKDKIV